MKILFAGEIVADLGRKTVKKYLPELVRELKPDLILANVENLSGGRGFTLENLKEMQDLGINYFTGGDHIFWQKGTEDYIESVPLIIPANYPSGTPGHDHAIIETGKEGKVLLLQLLGRTTFGGLSSLAADPFTKFDELYNQYKTEDVSTVIVDFHGDATSEKTAFGFYVDGRATAVIGTHTHVPTCDNIKLPQGTLYVTDVGMTGSIDSVLGTKKEIIINQFLTARNQRFEWESAGRTAFRSVLLDTREKTISRFDKVF